MIEQHVHIQIMVKQLELVSLLNQITSESYIKPQFTSSSFYDEDCNLDALITDMDDHELCQVKNKLPNKTLVIYCVQPEKLSQLSSEALTCIDYFWFLPLTKDQLTVNYLQIIKRLEEKWDAQLNQIFLNTVIDSVPDLIWFKDIKGSHLKVNQSFCNAVGKTKQQCHQRGHYYIWDLKQEEYEKGEYVCLETEEIVMKEKKTFAFDERVKSKAGLRQFKTYKSPLFNSQHELIGTCGVAHDVTDLQNMNAELDILLRSLPFSVLVVDQQSNILIANDQFGKQFNESDNQIIGVSYETWKANYFRDCTLTWDGNEVEILQNGVTTYFVVHEEPILDIFHDQVGMLCIWHDITVEKSLRHQIIETANTDFLTKLYNRRYFYQYIANEWKTQPITLLYLDVDNFKQINDLHGHQVGDQVLITVAQLMQKNFSSAMNTRLGGDEFLATFLDGITQQQLLAQAQALQNEFQLDLTRELNLPGFTLSMGIATTRDVTLPIDSIIQLADNALYQAKESGKAKICLYK